MVLKSFKATQVHGYLNYSIEFEDKLTFLIGINGTGKTSVLKLILGLISPSYEYLNSIDFQTAELACYDAVNGSISIAANKISDDTVRMSLLTTLSKIDYDDNIQIFPDYHEIRDPEEKENILKSLLEKFNQLTTVKTIKSLSTPYFLGLDRRIYSGQEIDRMRQSIFYRRRFPQFKLFEPLDASLKDIQEMIYDFKREVAARQQEIYQDFKNMVLYRSFEFMQPENVDSLERNAISELENRRDSAIKAFDSLDIKGMDDQIKGFFDQMIALYQNSESIATESSELIKRESALLSNNLQLKRIDQLTLSK